MSEVFLIFGTTATVFLFGYIAGKTAAREELVKEVLVVIKEWINEKKKGGGE